MPDEYEKPSKRASTLKAGGGQSSALSDHQTLKELSFPIARRLEEIYRNIVVSGVQEVRDGPLLSSLDDFLSWFKSPASAALAPPPDHDLTLPLCNYYISSSHNTYLSGNQLYGSATTSSYTDVLLRGCRCLEIDVWNGEDEASSVSSSDIEDAENDRAATQKKSHGTLSKLRSMKSKAKEKLRRGSDHPPEDDEYGIDDLTLGLTATQIAERRARLKAEPRVYHGYTLTKDIPFREVCEAIARAAFKASTLPIIVSLEVHCNLDQQKVMVRIMRETWAGHLIDMTGKSYQEIHELPSPDSLRNKILIKVKWSPGASASGNDPNELAHTITNDSSQSQTDGASSSKQKKKAAKILDELSKLGVYTRAYSFKSFSQPEAKIPTHVFSIDENKLGNLHSHYNDGPIMFQHNRDYLVRIYPSGLRVNSSNIDPAFSWRQGAQIVALNWQSLDKGMMLNEGMFAGEEGYVLKPHGFRSSTISEQTRPVRRKLNLSIRLIAAQRLPCQLDKDPSHVHDLKPYVKIQLHVDTHGPPGQGKTDPDAPTADLTSKYSHEPLRNRMNSSGDAEKDDDARKLKRKSKAVKTISYKNTNTNDFEDGEMIWTDVPDVVEQLSFLRIKVADNRMLGRDELVAWACIRLDRLKTGYRFIHLLDVEGSPSEGVLLVKIDKSVR